ncbi:MAG: ATP-dependent helicase HrpB, partial [Gammaproteobacteria bacterium]|nr:ATP-dependent helicase HrpB [Gammaproteobacteria bacterium]
RAAPVDEAALHRDFGDRFSERDETRWDAGRRALVAERVRRFAGIVLDSRPTGRPDPAAAAQALTDAVRSLGLEVLPWSDALGQWRARVAGLRAWMPELGLPDLGDDALMATLDHWLRPAFKGKSRLDALGADDLSNALRASLDWALQQKLDALAPVRITVPSGQARVIDYAIGDDGAPRPPVLAVKLQELFGLADTPRIADGRVPLLLHLLSPAGRPLQVTADLRSFWDRTWSEVRREMKGRYPRHPWPEDPWNAVPTHRARPRG